MSLVRALSLYASVLGKRFGVNVVFEKVRTAATDGKTVYVDPAYGGVGDERMAVTLFGLVGHESMHLLQTEFEAIERWLERAKKESLNWSVLKHLQNTIEDVWGETVFSQYHPGVWKDIVQSMVYMREDALYGPPGAVGANVDPAAVFMGWWLSENLARHYELPDYQSDAREWQALARQVLGDELLDRLLAHVPKAKAVRSTEGAFELAKAVYDEVQAAADGQPSDGAGQGPQDESDDSEGDPADPDNSQEGAGDDQAGQSQPQQGEAEPGQGTGASGDDGQPQGDQSEQAQPSSSSPEGEAGSGDGKSDQQGDEKGPQASSSSSSMGQGANDDASSSTGQQAGGQDQGKDGQGGQPGAGAQSAGQSADQAPGQADGQTAAGDARDSFAQAAQAILDAGEESFAGCKTDKGDALRGEADQAVVRFRAENPGTSTSTLVDPVETSFTPCTLDFYKQKGMIRNALTGRLEELLTTCADVGYEFSRTGIRLAGQRLAQIKAGRLDVFMRREESTDIDIVFDVLLDSSFSMQPVWASTLAAGYAVADVLAAHQVPFGLMQFSDQSSRVHQIGKKWSQAMHLPKPLEGCTNTFDALARSAAALLNEPQVRKVILVINDGEPDDLEATLAVVREIQAQGLEVVHIFLGSGGGVYAGRLADQNLGSQARCENAADCIALARLIEAALSDSLNAHMLSQA